MKMLANRFNSMLGGRAAKAQPRTTVVGERPSESRTKRFFYHLRNLGKGVVEQGPQERTYVTTKPRSEAVIPTKQVINLSNHYAALTDEVANATPAQLEEIGNELKVNRQARELVGPNGTNANVNMMVRTGIVPRPALLNVRRVSLPETIAISRDNGAQTETLTQGTQDGNLLSALPGERDPELDTTVFIPKRKVISKLAKDKNTCKVYGRLLVHLRCKYHLTLRDKSLIQRLVQEARNWMIKAGFDCTKEIHYTVLASAVTAAFMVSDEELEFRAMIKNRQNYENMVHLNNTLQGNLGRVANPLTDGGAFWTRPFLHEAKLPGATTTL